MLDPKDSVDCGGSLGLRGLISINKDIENYKARGECK